MMTVVVSTCIAAVIAFVIGAVVAHLKGASKIAGLQVELRTSQEMAARLQTELSDEKTRTEDKDRLCQSTRDEYVKAQAQLNAANTEIERLKKEHDDALARLKTQTEELMAKLQATSEATVARLQKELLEQNAKCITDNSKSLKDANAEQMNEFLKPFREQYAELQKSLSEQQKDAAAAVSKFDEQYRSMLDSAKTIGDRANILQNVLMGSNKLQGNWGEFVLERLLEAAGLERDIHFLVQKKAPGATDNTDANGVGIPDVTLLLPEDHVIYIDSKANIKALNELETAQDESRREECRKAFLEGVKTQIKNLDSKAYQRRAKEAGKETLDFVIMFIPSEGAFRCVFESREKALMEQLERRDVVLTGPSTLLPVLKLIHQQWRYFQTIRNQEEIHRNLENFVKRVESFLDEFMAIQRGIEQSEKAFDKAFTRLRGGQGALVSAQAVLKLRGKKSEKLEKAVEPDIIDVTEA